MPEIKRRDFVSGSAISAVLLTLVSIIGFFVEFSVLDLFDNRPSGVDENWTFYLT